MGPGAGLDAMEEKKSIAPAIFIKSVQLATEPGISLIILPLMRILQRNLSGLQTHSFSFLTQRTYSCNILIGVRIIKEMPGSVASGTHCISICVCEVKG